MMVDGVYTVCSVLSERRCSADAGLEHGLDAGHCVASLGVVAFVLHAAPQQHDEGGPAMSLVSQRRAPKMEALLRIAEGR